MKYILLFGMPGGWELIIMLLVIGLPSIIWLWALIDVLKSEFTNSSNKIIWILLIIFLPLLGAILYLAVGRGQKIKAVS